MLYSVNYNDFGLAIGLISYSFKTNGKDLFEKVFKKDLFQNHRTRLQEFTKQHMDDGLYEPKGYRLFGNHGLAVLSLIDDYAFCNRVFNDNHTDTATAKDIWSSKIITGISDSENYIFHKAKDTFLRQGDHSTPRYPFIGIMKLKIDHRLLRGRGINFTILVKTAITRSVLNHDEAVIFDHIIIDCFDDDELSVIAFSNNLSYIQEILNKIRELKNNQMFNLFLTEEKSSLLSLLEEKELDKHVFSSCHISLGYDVNYEWDQIGSTIFIENCSSDLCLNFICETKPGHSEKFHDYIKNYFKDKQYDVNLNITGGSVRHLTFPANEISDIEKLCLLDAFSDHVRRVKISLRLSNTQKYKPEINEHHEQAQNNESESTEYHVQKRNEDILTFDQDFFERMKEMLNQCGVSKIVRERLLSIYRLYNECTGNLLHSAYFEELVSALKYTKIMLEQFSRDEKMSIQDIEEILTKTIDAFEVAFYNRFHEKGLSNNNLEYNGSIQQYLTSFDFLYKQIIRILLPHEDIKEPKLYERVFAIICGHEKVVSDRMNLQLNINQITYPEFFATTVWKEALNNHKQLSYDYSILKDVSSQKRIMLLSNWSKFISNDASFDKIKFFLEKDNFDYYHDEIYSIIHKSVNKEFLNYLIIDQIAYHFGFHRNFELFWHFYWKVFLQTSNIYIRKGVIGKNYFIDMLLRVMIIGVGKYHQISPGHTIEDLLDEYRKKPYDSVMADLWLSCYNKVYECAKTIHKRLDIYGFSAVCESHIRVIEHSLAVYSPDLKEEIKQAMKNDSDHDFEFNKCVLTNRQKFIDVLRDPFKKCKFNLPTVEECKVVDCNFIICLLNAFLLEIKEIDLCEKDNAIIYSVPRDRYGKEYSFIADPEISRMMINMPADPFGGLLIPNFKIRKKYFSIRSVFYRSIWNYQMISYPSNN